MKKRISQKEWEYIGKYNPASKWIRPFCSYSLVKIDGWFRRECKVSWPMYLLLFIPVHLFQLLLCLWDGGLKEFTLESRDIGYDEIAEHGINSGAFPMAEEIWEKHQKRA